MREALFFQACFLLFLRIPFGPAACLVILPEVSSCEGQSVQSWWQGFSRWHPLLVIRTESPHQGTGVALPLIMKISD